MEAFDFAVGLWPAGSGLFDGGAGGGTGAVPEPGFVAAAVVGEDTLGLDAAAAVPAMRSSEKGRRGRGGLVRQDFDIGQSAVVIDADVDELPAPTPVAATKTP